MKGKKMKQDLVNLPQKAQVDGVEYLFEYDYSALSELEDATGKGVYVLYNALVSSNGIKLEDSINIMRCAMVKHHTEEQISELQKKIIAHPGVWLNVKEPVLAAFILPLLPPEILRKTTIKTQKKK